MKLLWSVSEPEPFDARALCMSGGRIFQLSPRKVHGRPRRRPRASSCGVTRPRRAKELFDAIGSALKRQGWGLGWATYCCARAERRRGVHRRAAVQEDDRHRLGEGRSPLDV